MEKEVLLDELEIFAETFWKNVKEATVFAVHGPMGAGKTTTIAALCRSKGVKDAVSSPTFSIINEYAYAEDGAVKKIFHMDLYRLNGQEEIIGAGVEDCLFSGEICFVEWAEKAPFLFDEKTVHLLIKPVDAMTRKIRILSTAQFNIGSMEEQL